MDEPTSLGASIQRLLDERGWEREAATAGVLARWAELAGPELADHCVAVSLHDGVLTCEADSTAWATQVRMLATAVVARINEAMLPTSGLPTGGLPTSGLPTSGPGTPDRVAPLVRRLVVRGPTAPARAGRLRSPDSRGPRDTYG
jgi:predicted nucleic acid-binding Zn ribbon protein